MPLDASSTVLASSACDGVRLVRPVQVETSQSWDGRPAVPAAGR